MSTYRTQNYERLINNDPDPIYPSASAKATTKAKTATAYTITKKYQNKRREESEKIRRNLEQKAKEKKKKRMLELMSDNDLWKYMHRRRINNTRQQSSLKNQTKPTPKPKPNFKNERKPLLETSNNVTENETKNETKNENVLTQILDTASREQMSFYRRSSLNQDFYVCDVDEKISRSEYEWKRLDPFEIIIRRNILPKNRRNRTRWMFEHNFIRLLNLLNYREEHIIKIRKYINDHKVSNNLESLRWLILSKAALEEFDKYFSEANANKKSVIRNDGLFLKAIDDELLRHLTKYRKLEIQSKFKETYICALTIMTFQNVYNGKYIDHPDVTYNRAKTSDNLIQYIWDIGDKESFKRAYKNNQNIVCKVSIAEKGKLSGHAVEFILFGNNHRTKDKKLVKLIYIDPNNDTPVYFGEQFTWMSAIVFTVLGNDLIPIKELRSIENNQQYMRLNHIHIPILQKMKSVTGYEKSGVCSSFKYDVIFLLPLLLSIPIPVENRIEARDIISNILQSQINNSSRRRAINLYKKWVYNEGRTRSEHLMILKEAFQRLQFDTLLIIPRNKNSNRETIIKQTVEQLYDIMIVYFNMMI